MAEPSVPVEEAEAEAEEAMEKEEEEEEDVAVEARTPPRVPRPRPRPPLSRLFLAPAPNTFWVFFRWRDLSSSWARSASTLSRYLPAGRTFYATHHTVR